MARRQTNQLQPIEVDAAFPMEGLDEQRAYTRQRPGTTVAAQNVQTFEPGTSRARGGMRSGITPYFPATDSVVVAGKPIQCIDHCVTNVATQNTPTSQSTFALTSGNGFGLVDNTGTNIVSGIGNVSGFIFACSCWDSSGSLYLAEINTSSGAVTVYSVTAAGAVTWTNSGNITVVTGSVRSVCGMVVIGSTLYLACKTGASAWTIYALTTSSGTQSVFVTNAVTGFTNLVFSTSAIQCLGAIGNLLGVECTGAGAAVPGFMIIDTTVLPSANAPLYQAHGGTAANNRSCVVSDTIGTFYTVASVTSGKVRAIGSNATLVWSSTAIDSVVQGIAFDFSSGLLLAACSSSNSIRQLNLADGTAGAAVGNPDSITAWNWIDCDFQGRFTVWHNGQSSNDVMSFNITSSAPVTLWGPITRANVTHDGCSVNKGMQTLPTSGSKRVIRGLLITNGQLKRFDTTGTYSLSGGQSYSPSAPVIFSAQLGTNMFFVDGVGYFYYQSSTDSVVAWTPASGVMPVDSLGTRARLITMWRGRLVLAGLVADPNNWFMSAAGDAFDFNYSPATPSATQAVAGTTTDTGLLGDVINTLIPFNDDTLIVGCNESIWQFTGDPADGGQLDAISHRLGMAWGRPWAIDLFGQIYFFGNRSGIFKMTPGALPVRISQQIERRLEAVDYSQYIIRMAWDIALQGLRVWITPLDATKPTIHYLWEERTNAWWPIVHANNSHNPLAVHLFDGDTSSDRVTMIGGRDGKVHVVSYSQPDDDGTPIQSYVTLGPYTDKDLQELLLFDLKAILGGISNAVTYSVFVGNSPEAALASAPVASGTWTAGLNFSTYIRRSGVFIYLQLGSTAAWALEKIRMRYAPTGRIRGRALADYITPPPLQPTALAAVAASHQVTLTWNFVNASYTYNLYRGTATGAESLVQTGVSGTVYVDVGLANSTPYYYKIAAVGAGGQSVLSAEVASTPTTGAVPAAPTGVKATAGDTLVSLNWSAVDDAASYSVYKGTSSGGESLLLAGITTPYYVVTSLADTTHYYFKVSATNASGEGSQSQEVDATPASTALPPAPTGLSITSGDTVADLVWNPVTGATSYKIYRGTAAGAESLLTSGNTPASYHDTGLTDGQIYWYYVTTTNGNGDSLATSNEAFAQPYDSSKPSAPVNLAISGETASSVSLTWDATAKATSYNLWRGTATNAEMQVQSGIATNSVTDTDPTLQPGTTYYYKVQAQNNNGTSALSTEKNVTTTQGVPGIPTGVLAVGSVSSVTLTWVAVPGATSYNLYRSNNSNGEGTTPVKQNILTNTTTDTGLSNGGTYFYTVAAVNAQGTGTQSLEVNATLPVETVLFFDAFVGTAATLLESHAPVTGTKWTAATAAGGITLAASGRISPKTASPLYLAWPGTSNANVTMTMSGYLGSVTAAGYFLYFIGRYTSGSYLVAGIASSATSGIGVAQIAYHTSTASGTFLGQSISVNASAHTWAFVLSGTTLSLYEDNVLLLTTTDTKNINPTSTQHGIYLGKAGDSLTSFQITAP